MPDLTAQTDALVGWLTQNSVALAIAAAALFIVYRWARPAIHRIAVRALQTQSAALTDDPLRRDDVEKRVATVEDIVVKALRGLVVFAFVAVILSVFDLWSVLAGLGLVLAAITLAGQAIVLDYLMGILILVEGQYYKGDIVRVGTIEGTVEEVGLRRTVIRDVRGTVHSVSNGQIRSSSNLTRSFAIAAVQVEGIADGDIERTIAVLDAVGQAAAEDPTIGDALLETPRYTATTRLSAYGATLRMGARVLPERRVAVEAELRRRVAAELAANGIVPIRAPGGAIAPSPDVPPTAPA